MKIRQGFVSNSSSSSFIISGFDCTKVLSEMIKVSKWDNKKDAVNLAAFKKSPIYRNFKANNIGAMFITCNYNTYIYYSKLFNNIVVETCKNTFWNESEYISSSSNYIREDSPTEQTYKNEIKDILFYNINCKKLLSYEIELSEDILCVCKKCGHRPFSVHKHGNKFVCGTCFTEIKN
jgi:hypothetical protein